MNPAQHFQRYFDVCKADSRDSQEQAFRIRYQVYCREFGYEAEENCPDGRERDEYDNHSRHSLLIHKGSQHPVGCVRLVEANPLAPELPLPFERHCAAALDRHRFDPDEFLPGQVAEFSRLAVVAGLRRRHSDQGREINLPQQTLEQRQRRGRFPVIPVSLLLAALSMLMASDADYGVAMLDPQLAQQLRQFGIHFERVGKTIDYQGPRAPYLIHRDNALRYLRDGVGELFFEINRSLYQRPEFANPCAARA
ncbi:PEP-CTERM/exosortase system-associated acyltransferase [Exilibacterium tricleocarpae]|uniref:PEP-CTERM/exosortase system-associated acyltransferase n=1 Tax=Exilibacterium tricleocarpae TaxID=2591008 RepID=A0A545SY57_9GAMM|nr:PEP-CTERM/exosortase system-associated acyltransferase [Exilibacterium tricleocarpae]TQV69893.1 PEP-CTERM/exosortase system-associated acyltransferase [Exilibacterium tricleocarpae]